MLRFFGYKRKKPEKRSKPAITVVPNSFHHVDSGSGMYYNVGAVHENLPTRHSYQAPHARELVSLRHPLRANPPPNLIPLATMSSLALHNCMPTQHAALAPVRSTPHVNSVTSPK